MLARPRGAPAPHPWRARYLRGACRFCWEVGEFPVRRNGKNAQ